MNYSSILWTIFVVVLNITFPSNGQRVAPGVPPQHYQQPPQYQQPGQQHYQQQGQHQPPPQQYQNVPQQQHYQQPAPVQHVDQYGNIIQQPPQQQQQQHHQPQAHAQPGGHHHGGHGGHPQQVLHTGNLQDEKDHIAEHMDVPIDTSKMTDQELQFHYFKMHDADNNNKLDGCELIKSLIHWHGVEEASRPEERSYSDEEISKLVDNVLKNMDMNGDGWITYPEFLRGK